jgi:hypothetical protein
MPLLKPTSNSFPASKKILDDIPYVMRVEFSGLTHEVRKIVGKPIACERCGGYLISTDQIVEDPKVGKHFICPFCGTLNVVEGEIITAGDESDFLITPPPSEDESTEQEVSTASGAFLALIDVSGSMGGANLEAVKRSLRNSIDSLAANSPETLFGIIEFESSVAYRNPLTGEAVHLPREAFPSLNRILETSRTLLDDVKMVAVGKNSDRLKKHVADLGPKGGTALGPAVAMGYTIAKHRDIGRLLLLTDGLANEGVGSLEGFQVTPATDYYEQMGQMFRDIGTAFDVVGIAGGSGMELKTLGLLPEATGGQMYYVTPNELDRSMSALAGASSIARDVIVRMITPPGVRVKDASGMSRAVIDEMKSKKSGKVGVVGENHELYFEMEPEEELDTDSIPVQLQVEYLDKSGARRIRSVTTRLNVTKDEDEIMASFDPKLAATFTTQKAGEEAFRGKHSEGAKRIASFRKAMTSRAKQAPSSIENNIRRVDKALASEEEELQQTQEMMKKAPRAGPSAAADLASTKSFAQMRRNSRALLKDDDEDEE